MRLLDLFCCGGGASRGYAQAGFDIVGVDIEPQAGYPFQFVLSDAIEFALEHGDEFDAIHASPPCQGYSPHVSSFHSPHVQTKGKGEPMLIDAVREVLSCIGKPFVIENVMGAASHMRDPILLCGSMFGLATPRHRLFESSEPIFAPEHPKCSGMATRFAREHGLNYRDLSVTGKGRGAGTSERWKWFLGITGDLSQHQLAESIPPAYSKWIGEILLGKRAK